MAERPKVEPKLTWQCFLIVPTGMTKRWLRRYVRLDAPCPAGVPYHNGMAEFDVVPEDAVCPEVPHSDYRWPKFCTCGYKFREEDEWQVFTDSMYRATDNGKEYNLHDAPAGAMWDATWMHEHLPSPQLGVLTDGKYLVLRLPNGSDWAIDSRCNNCERPNDEAHHCWCRHGEPPNITVDKNCDTCPAGAGSVLSNGFHAMLENGVLRQI